MKKLIKEILYKNCKNSFEDAFTVANFYQPEIPSMMAQKIEDKKD